MSRDGRALECSDREFRFFSYRARIDYSFASQARSRFESIRWLLKMEQSRFRYGIVALRRCPNNISAGLIFASRSGVFLSWSWRVMCLKDKAFVQLDSKNMWWSSAKVLRPDVATLMDESAAFSVWPYSQNGCWFVSALSRWNVDND